MAQCLQMGRAHAAVFWWSPEGWTRLHKGRVMDKDRRQHVSTSLAACRGGASLVYCPVRGRGSAAAADGGRTSPVGGQTRFHPLVQWRGCCRRNTLSSGRRSAG